MSNLSQEEIDALLQGSVGKPAGDTGAASGNQPPVEIGAYFTPAEIDALGEIGNICMGTSATTMNMLLNRKVTITTPQVSLFQPEDEVSVYRCPAIAVNVEFVEGLHGKNVLILQDYDAALITDLLMGGDGTGVDPDNITLTEMHLSAVSEVMNQMIGSAATAMSNMMGEGINISPPKVAEMEAGENVDKYLDGATPVVKVSFDMEIEGLLKSKLIQAMSIDMAKELISSLMHVPDQKEERVSAPEPEPVPARPISPPPFSSPVSAPSAVRGGQSVQTAERQRVKSVKAAQYESFDEEEEAPPQDPGPNNFDLINDIPLQVTVELGKTKKNLSDVLNLGVGSIIVLDKQAGDLVDVIVNGKQIAKGEVVVIDENYGVRITELIKQ